MASVRSRREARYRGRVLKGTDKDYAQGAACPQGMLPLARPESPGVLDVVELFQGRKELRLLFQNEEYRLRITRNQKLILTK